LQAPGNLQTFNQSIHFVRIETNPQFVGIVPPTDIVIATTFSVELENSSGNLSIVIPFSTLEPIRQKLISGFQQETIETDNYWVNMMVRHLEETGLNVNVELGHSNITMRQLLELKAGDTIPLSTDATAELEVQVEGVTRFRGLYGSSRGSRAIQVTEVVKNRNREFLKRRSDSTNVASGPDDLS
jgi:flagellar motor switch protein FliM